MHLLYTIVLYTIITYYIYDSQISSRLRTVNFSIYCDKSSLKTVSLMHPIGQMLRTSGCIQNELSNRSRLSSLLFDHAI